MRRPLPVRAALPGLLLAGLFAVIVPACAESTGLEGLCLQGQTTCGGICVNTLIDPSHCGTCGSVCGDGQSCEAGVCVSSCTAGLASCAGSCVDLQDDDANCGACNLACPGGTHCEAGACAAGCAEGLTHCGPVCADLTSDSEHCGGCYQACGENQICESSLCVISCGEGLSNCFGQCVDTQTSPQHCGGCGVSCGPGSSCEAGMCVSGCGPTQCGVCAESLGSTVPQSVPGSSAGQLNVLQSNCNFSGAPEAAFSFTAPASGTYSFSTQASSFDPVLTVFDGAGCFELSCNDDWSGLESRVDVLLSPGQSVIVMVEDLGGGSGSFTLNISQGGGSGGVCDGTFDCSLCADCAWQGDCADELDACINEPECLDVDTCVQGCADQLCIDSCVQQYPLGGPLYLAAVECAICDTCPSDCAGSWSCP